MKNSRREGFSDVQTYNAQTLAYIGDAVYELRVREHLLKEGRTKPRNLHSAAIERTNAAAQVRALEKIQPMLTDEEKAIVKRGRNAPLARKSRKEGIMTYKNATGLEALVGHLYLNGHASRLETLFEVML